MFLQQLYEKALALNPLDYRGRNCHFMNEAPLEELIFVANELRQIHNRGTNVGWMIDRNVNLTNVCFSQCSFCNFCRKKGDRDAYITTLEEYNEKIAELYSLGGDQLLLQGGMNPELGLRFYTDLFATLKKSWPTLKLHALGPPEIVFPRQKRKIIIQKMYCQS